MELSSQNFHYDVLYPLYSGSNYPLFIFLCPKIESKQYPWKKPNTLNYPNKIQKILAMWGKKQSPTTIHEKNLTPWTIREKNQTPWTIWILLWILQKHRIFLSLFYFSKNLAMFSFVLLSRLQANHCWMYKKMTMFKKIQTHYFIKVLITFFAK